MDTLSAEGMAEVFSSKTAAQKTARAGEAEVKKRHAKIGQLLMERDFGQGVWSMSLERRRQLIEPDHPYLSIVGQCALVGVSRSGFYHRPVGEAAENLAPQFLETPWYGSRQIARHLQREGHAVGRKRIRRLMATMGLVPIYQRPRTTVSNPKHRVFPYLLRDRVIERPNQVWCADITDIPMRRGFLYLLAVMGRGRATFTNEYNFFGLAS